MTGTNASDEPNRRRSYIIEYYFETDLDERPPPASEVERDEDGRYLSQGSLVLWIMCRPPIRTLRRLPRHGSLHPPSLPRQKPGSPGGHHWMRVKLLHPQTPARLQRPSRIAACGSRDTGDTLGWEGRHPAGASRKKSDEEEDLVGEDHPQCVTP
ncbi:hypothetical protein CSOJ01_02578 [Colletotrichum sojae]|uniref:Uncharacterized protein n=1 Tax=Colletotrichum sojae TaxID=2175907 RepID=A0A8H6N2I2_9PEZI|nr:hypothetical protein CSOJ01_02578 [Colletotrichum sojae]